MGKAVRIGVLALSITLAPLALVPAGASAALSSSQKKAIQKVGHDAYLFGYAPVYMNTSISRFPANALINVRYLATDQTRAIVKPNADTLYTISVLDVGKEPIIIETPPTGSRYFGLELLDSYTNVFGYIGSRVTGTTGGRFAIVGPGWTSAKTPINGSVTKVIKAPTPKLWIIGRTLIDGQADLPAVHAVQDAIRFQLNSKVGTSTFLTCINSVQPGQTAAPGCVALPAADSATAPVFPAPDAAFFKGLGAIMKAQPPLTQDKTVVASMKKYGIGAGLDPSKTQKADVLAELVKGAVAADAAVDKGLTAARTRSVTRNNGWIVFDKIGVYGTDFLTRAIIAKFGLGANLPAEAVYPAATTDYSGNELNGANGAVYRISFPSGQLPPTSSGFWSVTLYAEDQFFVANPLGRFAIGDRPFPNGSGNPLVGLAVGCGAASATDIYVSAAQPTTQARGACAANWLPAPAGKFNLMLRIYRPTAAVLSGTWKYPKITKVG